MPQTGAPGFEAALREAVRGDVYIDPMTRAVHATDASLYQQTPRAVVTPVDQDDAVAAIRVAHAHGVSITARGGATSLSGQTFGTGMVLDCSKSMDQVLEVNAQEQWARVEPGVVRDRLNAELNSVGLHFAPDPATGNRATIGGMVGNNTCGTRSVVYGKCIDHVIACKVALADGTVLELNEQTAHGWQAKEQAPGVEGHLYRGVRELIEKHRDTIQERYPKVLRRVSGYNLDEFVDGAGYTGEIGPRRAINQGARPWNLSNLVVGSEGTLAYLLEVTIRLTPLPKATALCVVHFTDLLDAVASVDTMLEHRPSTVELLDRDVMDEARVNPATKALAHFIEGEPGAVQIVEFMGESEAEAKGRADAFADAMRQRGVGQGWPVFADAKGQADVWNTRKLGLGLISNVKGPVKGRDFIEDACVPTDKLAEYLKKIKELCAEHGIDRVSMYAHASVGVVHVVPALDLHDPERVKVMKQVAEQAFTWVMEYGGSWSGEHGDGQLRGQFLPRMFGDELYGAFRDLKQLFDPKGLMNPGKVIDAPSMVEDLRYQQEGYTTRIAEVSSNYRYANQGGFSLAVEQCNGVGACRKLDAGTMCPSYMATKDETATTRGRANALRMAMSGQLGDPNDALAGEALQDVLSLCLSCKACKTECPNAVDMAKLKADVTQRHYDRHGTPMSARIVGSSPEAAARFAGPLHWVPKLALALPGARLIMEKLAKIDRRRPVPPFANTTLDRQLAKRPGPNSASSKFNANGSRGQVVLFDDTYAKFYEPHVGVAAVELLEGLGYEVTVARAGCCQRPRLSKGLVREAAVKGQETLHKLDAIGGDAPILCLEPSCATALADDLPDLIDDAELGQRVAKRVKMLEGFLAEAVEQDPELKDKLGSTADKFLLHGHCHQKAVFGTKAIHQLTGALDGVEMHEVDSGCCGMAGAFGYEHHDVSEKVGEDRLFPAVREAVKNGEEVVACGISCRHQLHDFLNVKAKHLVEVLKVK